MKAKRLAQEGNITEALDVNRQALKIHYSEKLQKRIAKMEEYLKNEDEEEEEDSGMIDLGHNFFLYKDLADKLYAHQREGVLWMWGLHVKRKGGILGDDMGLGKTIQVIAFLSGLFDMDKVKSVLIVMPVSVIVNWEKEFSRWAPGIRVNAYHGTKKEKDTALLKVQKRGGVLLTSYGLVVTSWEKLGQIEGREFKWDYMILDEGHKIKNPTKTTKGVHQIGAKNRIILTGTPIQNNLRARERDATAGERKLGMEMAESLKKIIAPYFLRRTKAEVTEKGIKKENSENPEDKKEKHLTKMPSLTRKNDFIVWLFLTPTQQRIYSDFLSLDHVKELLMTKKSPLVALTVLKKICDHPRLLSRRGCAQLGLDGDHRLDELDPDSEEGLECAANQIKDVADEILIGESGKVIVVVDLLDKMKEEGHRCLVFSQSRKMLDVIEQVIKNRGHKVMRLDGTVTQLAERDARIGKFQKDTSYSVFLLTTQVGGVGLTLTAADRVIIFDPSWNPATDAQAVDRVFRIGQDKNVVIYRLITCGTVEEKIYRRQIFKDSITRQTTGNSKNPYRYFTKQELRELFTLDNPRQSKTQIQLEEMHSGHRKTDPGLDAHVAFLYSLDIFGLSDHDLMFTQEKCDIDHPDDDDSGRKPMDHEDDYIQHRVQKAQELIRLESDLSQNFNERSGNQQRTVDGGQSGMNRPFAQPWQNWNFHGNVKNEEDFDGSEERQQPVKTEPTVSIKSESDSDVVDLTQIEDKDTPIDLTTPPESPKAKERHFHSPHSPPSNRPIKREPEHEDEGEVIPDVPPHSSPSKDLSIQIEEDSESATHIVEDFDHMSISESPQTSPVKVKREKVTPDKNAQMNGGLDSSVKVKVKEEVMTSDTEDEGKQSSGSLDRSGNTSDHGTVENDDVFTEPSLVKGNLTSANENDVIDLSTNENEDTTTSANESGALSLSANENPGMRLLSNQNDKDDQHIPQPSVSLSRDEELPIINMVTPSKKGRRRSVSQSPWLKKTPKSGSKNVIREEILISPDFNRPMVDIRPTKHQHSPRNGKNKVNLECTILSAFQDSPNIDEDKSRSRSHENVLGMTFVGESPVADVQVTHLHRTVVQDSPNTSLSRSLNQSTLSFNQSTDVVLDSVQNTPAVAGNRSVAKNSDDVIIGDSEGEETPKTSRYSKISRTSVNESESEEELPIMSFKKKKQGAIIDSEDSANEDDEMHDSMSKSEEGRRKLKNRIKSIENSESDEESMEASEADSDGMEISGTQEDENMTGESLTDESEEEEEEITKSSKGKKKNYVSDDEEEEEDDEGDDSMSGFIVDDSDEELDDDDDEDEASHGSEDDDETDEDDRMGKGTRKGASKKHSGKHLYKTGQYNEALVHVLQALEIYPDENMQALALKIHQKMMA
ncbi:hypothetical protein FSP39_007454 [Pinctada imbricata]|uniref:DNA excision repair protein ERCC-6-like n=1 Tax=Pinctada imbricata TaxID=66713 RepID=A0AA88XFF2_PINIB|nr:hypothetical protein FSP39_007454 [Pinctada imbricata]